MIKLVVLFVEWRVGWFILFVKWGENGCSACEIGVRLQLLKSVKDWVGWVVQEN